MTKKCGECGKERALHFPSDHPFGTQEEPKAVTHIRGRLKLWDGTHDFEYSEVEELLKAWDAATKARDTKLLNWIQQNVNGQGTSIGSNSDSTFVIWNHGKGLHAKSKDIRETIRQAMAATAPYRITGDVARREAG